MKTQYCTIHGTDEQIKRLNKNLIYPHWTKNENDLSKKVDFIISKVEMVLDLEYKMIKANIYLFNSRKELEEKCFEIYTRKSSPIAFCDRAGNMYLNYNDIDKRKFSHECGHLVWEAYFPGTPRGVHELIAQYVEREI